MIEKPYEKRCEEVKNLFFKLNELELNISQPGIIEFLKECRIYKNDGIGRSGKIKLSGLKRILEYKLSMNNKIDASINLKYNPEI